MSQNVEVIKKIKQEISISQNIWLKLLLSYFPHNIEYIYCKGSAVKSWSSPIDYVPLLSDLDIHVRFKEYNVSMIDFKTAQALSRAYKSNFLQVQENCVHLPRVQVNIANLLEQDPDIIYIKPKTKQVLFGNPSCITHIDPQQIRILDKQHLTQDIVTVIHDIPRKLFDRSGLDFWQLLRSLSWRVSSHPFRLLTQLIDSSPITIWEWNRSRLVKEYQGLGYEFLAEKVISYYTLGWDLFKSDFQAENVMYQIIEEAYLLFTEINNILANLDR